MSLFPPHTEALLLVVGGPFRPSYYYISVGLWYWPLCPCITLFQSVLCMSNILMLISENIFVFIQGNQPLACVSFPQNLLGSVSTDLSYNNNKALIRFPNYGLPYI